jgi:hypothetical protein
MVRILPTVSELCALIAAVHLHDLGSPPITLHIRTAMYPVKGSTSPTAASAINMAFRISTLLPWARPSVSVSQQSRQGVWAYEETANIIVSDSQKRSGDRTGIATYPSINFTLPRCD